MIFLFLVLFPVAEFYAWYLFIDHYSFLDALILMFFGGGFGLMIIRTQGKSVLVDLQVALAQGRPPEAYLLHRGIVMFGGLLIMLPGILTKVFGSFFILPGVRHLLVWYMKWYLFGKIAKGSFRIFAMGGMPGMGQRQSWEANTEGAPPAERDVVEIRPKKIERKEH